MNDRSSCAGTTGASHGRDGQSGDGHLGLCHRRTRIERQRMTCASGEKASERTGSTASTTASNGMSACENASRSALLACSRISVNGAAAHDAGAQHEGVDEHADERIEGALSRPATRVATAMSSEALSLANSTDSAACTTMNGVTPALTGDGVDPLPDRRRDTERRALSPVGRDRRARPVRQQLPARPADRRVVRASSLAAATAPTTGRPALRAPHAARSCSRRTAPLAGERRVGARRQGRVRGHQVSHQRELGLTVGRDVVVMTAAGARRRPCGTITRTGHCAATSNPVAASVKSSASGLFRARSRACRTPRQHRSAAWHPSTAGNEVRRISCRASTSMTARNAATSSSPVSRSTAGTLPPGDRRGVELVDEPHALLRVGQQDRFGAR